LIADFVLEPSNCCPRLGTEYPVDDAIVVTEARQGRLNASALGVAHPILVR